MTFDLSTLDGLIEYFLLRFPMRLETRADCLWELYFSHSNLFAWENGRITLPKRNAEDDHQYFQEMESSEKISELEFEVSWQDALSDLDLPISEVISSFHRKRQVLFFQTARDNLAEKMQDRSFGSRTLLPEQLLVEGKFFTAPVDIEESFLSGFLEAGNLAQELFPNDYTQIKKISTKLQEILGIPIP